MVSDPEPQDLPDHLVRKHNPAWHPPILAKAGLRIHKEIYIFSIKKGSGKEQVRPAVIIFRLSPRV